jgi:hypothetical protein
MYYVRTDTGIMIAKVDNVVAGCMMRQCKGEWTPKRFKRGPDHVYVFTEDFTYGDSIIKLCLWAGFYLVKEA